MFESVESTLISFCMLIMCVHTNPHTHIYVYTYMYIYVYVYMYSTNTITELCELVMVKVVLSVIASKWAPSITASKLNCY